MPCSDHSVSLDWCTSCAESDAACEKHAAYVTGLETEIARLLTQAGYLLAVVNAARRLSDQLDRDRKYDPDTAWGLEKALDALDAAEARQ